MELNWTWRALPPQDEVDEYASQLGIDTLTATLLLQRGMADFQSAKEYFNPSLDQLHDPFEMADMAKATERLSKALADGEQILIYGDYDVDGTTSVALVYGFLSAFYTQLHYYIPDRYTEGYGVSRKGIDQAKELGVSLIISLDCGVKDISNIRYAADFGIDFIVCDHHLPSQEVHPAYALLDPKRADCNYPYKELSGCGVGFKLMHALCLQQGIDLELLFAFLDLAAISIAADIVPITGENRVLASEGLKRINQSARPGVKALIQVSDFHKELSISNLVFGLAPRINAAGRIAHGQRAVDLLLTKEESLATSIAQEINQHNLSRREFDSLITQEALDMIATQYQLFEPSSTVLYKEDWHKGVVGIVASRCIEQFYRPTIILTRSHNVASGSARSVDGFDVYAAIESCKDLLLQFGGHQHAAGLSLEIHQVEEFRKRFDQAVKERIHPDSKQPRLWIDLSIDPKEINFRLFRIIQRMAPFGPGNMQPVFCCDKITPSSPRLLKEEHIKFSINAADGTLVDAIGFGMKHHYDLLNSGQTIDLCFQLQMNEYQGRQSLQLLIKDLRPSVDQH
jgi:single-stranded-DNA-specific exonuclease